MHDVSHRFGKLYPRGKNAYLLRYYEHSKGYVFIGENEDGSITELESRDATFLETEFPSRGDIDRTVSFYEITDEQVDGKNHRSEE